MKAKNPENGLGGRLSSSPMPSGWSVRIGLLLALALSLSAPQLAFGRSLEHFRIRDFKVGGDFTLTDQFGKKMALTHHRGKIVVLAFGFTHCPDVCPATVSTLSLARKKLKGQAKSASMIFVTVDPERDTPPVLKKYLDFFDENIVGLTGTLEEVENVANKYAAPFRKIETQSAGGYLVAHATFYFIINKEGKVNYILPHDAGSKLLVEGVRTLLKQG